MEEAGLELIIEEFHVSAAWVFNEGVEGYAQYPGELPYELSFADDLEGVAKKLGEPDRKPTISRRKVNGKEQAYTVCHYRQGKVTVEFVKSEACGDRISKIGFLAGD